MNNLAVFELLFLCGFVAVCISLYGPWGSGAFAQTGASVILLYTVTKIYTQRTLTETHRKQGHSPSPSTLKKKGKRNLTAVVEFFSLFGFVVGTTWFCDPADQGMLPRLVASFIFLYVIYKKCKHQIATLFQVGRVTEPEISRKQHHIGGSSLTLSDKKNSKLEVCEFFFLFVFVVVTTWYYSPGEAGVLARVAVSAILLYATYKQVKQLIMLEDKRKQEHLLQTVKDAALRLKHQLNLGITTDSNLVTLEAGIDKFTEKLNVERSEETPSKYTQKPNKCKMRGRADIFSDGCIQFCLDTEFEDGGNSPTTPVWIYVIVSLKQPQHSRLQELGRRQFVLKTNQGMSEMIMKKTHQEILDSNYIDTDNDTVIVKWEVCLRSEPQELNLSLIQSAKECLTKTADDFPSTQVSVNEKEVLKSINEVVTALGDLGENNPCKFSHTIDNVQDFFKGYNEIETPRFPGPQDKYSLQGKVIFTNESTEKSNACSMYLRLVPQKDIFEFILPVKMHWSVSVLKEDNKRLLEEKVSLFDRIRQEEDSLVSPDGINDISSSRLVTNGALKLEWSARLDSPLYLINAVDLRRKLNGLVESVEDNQESGLKRPGKDVGSQTVGHFKGNLTANLDILLTGRSTELTRKIGNVILGRPQFKDDDDDENVHSGWGEVEGHIVTAVHLSLNCNQPLSEKEVESSRYKLCKALVESEEGYHSIVFVSYLGESLEDGSREFLKTHLEKNVARDFGICAIVSERDPSDIEQWATDRSTSLGKLVAECSDRYVWFHPTNEQMNHKQREELFSRADKMKSREFRLIKTKFDLHPFDKWKEVFGNISPVKMDAILKRTELFMESLAKITKDKALTDTVESQKDEVEEKAERLQKELSDCEDTKNVLGQMKEAVVDIKDTTLLHIDNLKKLIDSEKKVKQSKAKCRELERQLEECQRKWQNAREDEKLSHQEQMKKLQSELDDAKETAKSFKEERKKIDQEREELEKKVIFLKDLLKSRYDHFNELLSEMRDDRVRATMRPPPQKKTGDIGKSLEEMEREELKLKNELAELKVEKETLQQANEELQDQTKEYMKTISELRNNLELMKQKGELQKKLQDELKQLKTDRKSLEKKIKELQGQKKNAEDEIKRLRENLELVKEKEERQKKLQEELQQLKTDRKSLEQKIKDLEAQKKNKEDENKKLRENLELLKQKEVQQKKLEDELKKLRAEKATLQQEKEELQNEMQNKEDENLRLRENLETLEENEEHQRKLEEEVGKLKREKEILQQQYEELARNPSKEEQMRLLDELEWLREKNEILEKEKEAPEPDIKTQQYSADPVADVNWTDEYGVTKLMKAVEEENDAKVQSLIRVGCHPDKQDKSGKTALMKAAIKDSEKCVTLLIEASSDVELLDKSGRTALMYAIENKSIKSVRLLINKAQCKVNVADKNGSTPLMKAGKSGYTEVVDLLIGAGSNVNMVDNDGKTALMYAVENSSEESAEKLINARSEVDKTDKLKRTALMLAAMKKSDKCVQLLIQKRARINLGDDDGITALMHAAMVKSKKCTELLIEANANVDISDNYKRTALMLAAMNGSDECVRLLIYAQSDINASDEDGMTPLMYAADGGHPQCLKSLIQAGAKVNLKCKANKTALQYARKSSQNTTECIQILSQAGAKEK